MKECFSQVLSAYLQLSIVLDDRWYLLIIGWYCPSSHWTRVYSFATWFRNLEWKHHVSFLFFKPFPFNHYTAIPKESMVDFLESLYSISDSTFVYHGGFVPCFDHFIFHLKWKIVKIFYLNHGKFSNYFIWTWLL